MYLKEHKKGRFQAEAVGYLTRLDANGVSKICFVSEENNIEYIEELVCDTGYDPDTLLGRRLLITIEDET